MLLILQQSSIQDSPHHSPNLDHALLPRDTFLLFLVIILIGAQIISSSSSMPLHFVVSSPQPPQGDNPLPCLWHDSTHIIIQLQCPDHPPSPFQLHLCCYHLSIQDSSNQDRLSWFKIKVFIIQDKVFQQFLAATKKYARFCLGFLSPCQGRKVKSRSSIYSRMVIHLVSCWVKRFKRTGN